MKTAEEWAAILNEIGPDELTIDTIIEIQLDAYRAGGLAAAEMAAKIKKEHNAEMSEWEMGTGAQNCEIAILTHFNNPKLEIPE